MQNNNEALGRFMALVGEIVKVAEAIRDAADEHFDTDPDEVDWTHVGDATWARDQLRHVLAVIRGEEGK